MQIFVNNRLASIKKGTSFEYVSENRLFSGSDDYTLSIVFPLKGCKENIAIFGNINRADVEAQKVVFDCEMRDVGFYKFGSITITEISESEVKTQFLEGRSEQNFDKTFDKVYINELDLGAPSQLSTDSVPPMMAWSPAWYSKFVCLPWVNDSSGNIQNCPEFVPEVLNADGSVKTSASWKWHDDTAGLSWQPYLLHITKKICEAIGYSCDLSKWEARDEFKYLLICNSLPYVWGMPGFANALPHWTVDEYFEKLELFLGCEFDFNHRTNSINFNFTQDLLQAKQSCTIENVIEEYQEEVSTDDENCEYSECKNLVYSECEHSMWKFYSCDWFMKSWSKKAIEYDTMQDLIDAAKHLKIWYGTSPNRGDTGPNSGSIMYVKDVDMYFVVLPIKKTLTRENQGWIPNLYSYDCVLQPINLFGGRIVNDDDDADEVEIDFVPACIDRTDETYGKCLFLSFQGFDESSEGAGVSAWGTDPAQHKKEVDDTFFYTQSVATLNAGEKDKETEFYDKIYVGYWDGKNYKASTGKLPYPFVDNVIVSDDWGSYMNLNFSLRINDKLKNVERHINNINPKSRVTFKFLSDKIPDVRSLFIIRGKRYVCEKITATFTENGMSQLLKGVFYPVKD